MQALAGLLSLSPNNRKHFELLESSILTVCLDDTTPGTRTEVCPSTTHIPTTTIAGGCVPCMAPTLMGTWALLRWRSGRRAARYGTATAATASSTSPSS
jgi:hypothetical protein